MWTDQTQNLRLIALHESFGNLRDDRFTVLRESSDVINQPRFAAIADGTVLVLA